MKIHCPSILFSVAIALACSLATATIAHADDDIAAAGRAYSKAQAAELAHKHQRAAVFYELADNTANAAEALRGAARTRYAAGDLALAASHALELLRRYPDDESSTTLAERILAGTADKLSLVEVRCEKPCTVTLDGAAVGLLPASTHAFYASPGPANISSRFDNGTSARHEVALNAGRTTRLEFFAPPPERRAPQPSTYQLDNTRGQKAVDALDARPAATPAEPGGLERVWFVGGVIVTLGLGGAATWSGLDVLENHEDYEENPTEAGYQDGLRRERRTNLLIGAAAASAAATLTVALFTRWRRADERPPRRRSLVVAPTEGGAILAVDGSF